MALRLEVMEISFEVITYCVVEASGFRSFTSDCQHCGAQNTFRFSPIATSHRPPSGTRQCSEGNCWEHFAWCPSPQVLRQSNQRIVRPTAPSAAMTPPPLTVLRKPRSG